MIPVIGCRCHRGVGPIIVGSIEAGPTIERLRHGRLAIVSPVDVQIAICRGMRRTCSKVVSWQISHIVTVE